MIDSKMINSGASDISAIITFHGEELLAHKTLLGLERLRVYAEDRGVSVEFVVVLDNADPETERVVESSPVLRESDQVVKVSNGDLGASRNSGIAVANGHCSGIFDGDDYYSENWLFEAFNTLKQKQGGVVVHPDYAVSFGAIYSIGRLIDMDREMDYPIASCFSVHPWVSSSFGATELYRKIPYVRSDTKSTGFGFEDWHWNLELLGHGVRHVSALQTTLFYRRKPMSMLVNQVTANAIVRPSSFFSTANAWGANTQSLESVTQGRVEK